MTLNEEVAARVREYMLSDPEADEGRIRQQFYPLVRDERRKRAEAAADHLLDEPTVLRPTAPETPDPEPRRVRISSLLASGLLKKGSDL